MASVDPTWFFVCAGLLGLIAGSFINVVIMRLPRMLETAWHLDATAILGRPTPADKPQFNLAYPRSTCPACQASIRPWHNIPVISFIILRGHCAACHGRISLQYPLVELASCGLTLACAWRFGASMACLPALLFTWALLAIAVIDWRTQLLPDNITLPLLWLGLLTATAGLYVSPISAIIGAVVGYLVLWLVYHGFRLLTGKHGMGHGDFKLLAALGAWLGWQQLPVIVFAASVTGAVTGLVMIASGQLNRDEPMPFGPFLAAAGWLSLIAGDTMLQNYLTLVGLS